MGGLRGREALVRILLTLAIVLGGLCATESAGAQIVTTTVADTVFHADGTTAAGTAIVSWGAFTTVGGSAVAGGTESVTIGAGGGLRVALAPNAGGTPVGSYYTVVFHLDDGSLTKEYWAVPVSGVPVNLQAVRSTVLPASVALQTVSKSYVDTAIATAVAGGALQGAPFVEKTGDTMTGALVLAGDPVAGNQAADKHYVDTQVASVPTGGGGSGGGVLLLPGTTQVVAQPAGSDLETNRLNGVEYAKQYGSGSGNNGIAGATGASDCVAGSVAGLGCLVTVEPTVSGYERYAPPLWANGTHVVDERLGGRRDSFYNPHNPIDKGNEAGQVIDVQSSESTQAIFAATGAQEVQSAGLIVNHSGLAGGSNLFPENIESAPYFKTNYVGLQVKGTYNTQGQHVLVPAETDCFAVGDCLIGSQFVRSMGGFRDSADEGAHPFDIQVMEDPRVFTGTCAAGCTTGSQAVTVGSQAQAGTQGDGRFLIDKNPALVITQGQLTGGSATGIHPSATFSGSTFPVSVFFTTAAAITSQAQDIAPGTVTFSIATFGVPAGYGTNTAAAPSGTGVACVADRIASASPQNYEMANYAVVDGTHLQMTLAKPHAALATVAIGGLCGYGVEQTVDTVNGMRQVFPVIGSSSATSLIYAGGQTAILGIADQTSGYRNVNLAIISAVRSNNLVTLTLGSSSATDLSGLTLAIAGVGDSSFNGSFPVASAGPSTLTYAESGPNTTSGGGTASFITGGYALYPMAEVTSVFNPGTKGVDGLMTLAPNTVAWAANDPVEQPHYFQIIVGDDIHFVSQTTPRPSQYQRIGYQYNGNNGPGLQGFEINNASPASNYLGNGGTHAYPGPAFVSAGIWSTIFDVQTGETALFRVHCNSKGCNKWNSTYDLFEMDSAAGVDTINYAPTTSTLAVTMRGIGYSFTPQAFTAATANLATVNAATVNTTTLNATTLSGALNAANVTAGTISPLRLPVMGASGAGHAVGAVPDPGATAGVTRYLREDGTWFVPPGGAAGVTGFNGRSGTVTPATGDYSFGQIAGSLSATQLPGLSGDVVAAAGSTATTLATVNATPGTFGSSGQVPVLTVDAKGRLTAVATAAIAGPGGALPVAAALNVGLLADYNFYQGTGTTLLDGSGNGNSGTFAASAPTWTATGLAFQPGQGVSLPAALNGAKTIMAEVYLNPLTSGTQVTNQYPSFLTSSLGGTGLNLLTTYATNSSNYAVTGAYSPAIYGGGVHKSSAPNLMSGLHTIGYELGTSSGDLDHLYIDGTEVASYQVQTFSSGLQTSGNLYFGSSGASPWATSGLNGTAYRMRAYSTQLTSAQMYLVSQAMFGEAQLRGVPTNPVPINLAAPQLHCVGDSITYGQNASYGYCSALSLTNQPTYTITNWGISGITMQAINNTEANRVALRCQSSSGPDIAIVFAGTNDFAMAGFTPQVTITNLLGEIQTLKKAGCRVFAGTMISRTGADGNSSTFDADKNAYNNLILTQARGAGADGIVDFAANPLLGADGANANATYFNTDHIHPTTAGQNLLAAEASNALNFYFGASEAAPKVVTALPYTMAAGDGYVSLLGLTGAGGLTLPDCTGQSGAVYRVNNPQSGFAVTVIGSSTSQPINGLTTAVTVPANASVALRDAPNARSTGGCHWEM